MPPISRRHEASSWVTLALALAALPCFAAPAPDLGTDQQRQAGKPLYDRHCSQCHGEKGDGLGVAAPFLSPKPRDFTSGKFKIRTTPSGALPTTQDLKAIIRAGMPYTAMPGWPQFNDRQLTDVAYYVKSFAADFADPDRQPEPIQSPPVPAISGESIGRGKKLYEELGCARCHGETGRSDGVAAPTLTDDWGYLIRSADLTRRWTFRGGPTRQEIFRAFSTGLNGTPMPSFVDALTVEQRWDLADFVYSLSPRDSPEYATLLVAKKVARELDLAEGAKLFEEAEPAYFPVIGQIMQPGRAFHPSCNGIAVRAVYNETDIAFELRWNDMRAEVTGKNGPELAVAAAEDEGDEPAAAPPAAEGGGGWGDAEAAAPAAEPAAAPADVWGEGEAGAAASAAVPQSEFSDAVAIQFPAEKSLTIRKPYFVFGDKGNAVNLWFVDLAKPEPALYVGRGSDSLEPLGPRDLTVTRGYDKGEWTVVFKRRLRSQGEVTFEEQGFLPIAFSVWDGLAGERGNKRGLTNWWTVYLSPDEKPSLVREMAKWGGLAFALEVVFIGWARRRAHNSAGS
ncbi:MAG: c-type cytochrome [Deltaproteobacteria bacterium]|nr:c-type cytochrome [Deltaproteobacteria bacterium]